MTELDWCDSLGIILDPDRNKLPHDGLGNLADLSRTFAEMLTQKRRFGTLNPDLWLEFIPWHSLN